MHLRTCYLWMIREVGNEGSIYAARQGMRACNNNIVKRCREGLRMLLLHALIPCLAAYILPSSPAFIHCLAANILHLFPYFLALSSLHPSTFYGNVFTSLFHWFFIQLYRSASILSFTHPRGVLQNSVYEKHCPRE